MTPRDFCEFHPCFDLEEISQYPNHFTQEWVENILKFDGIESHSIQHIVFFLEYVLNLDVSHEDVLVMLFLFSLEMKEKYFLSHISNPKTIYSYDHLFRILFKCWGLNHQDFKDFFKYYVVIVQENKRYKVIKTFENHEI
jgi:hypothetical protein